MTIAQEIDSTILKWQFPEQALVLALQVVVKVGLVNMLFLCTILVVSHLLPKIGPYAKLT